MDTSANEPGASAASPLECIPLLSTKLRQPRARSRLVGRARLTERLSAGLDRALTLISAPVGFGKTTLLGEWLASAAQAIPIAWLSLDEDDNDPVRFLTYVAAALNEAQESVGASALALLRSPNPPPAKAILTSLLNDLADSPDDLILVLDDYHVIGAPAIHDALAFLLGNPPPRMHLVIATRSDPPLPLSRLRARDELVELRSPELLFTLEEAETFLNGAMELGLSAGDVRTLQSSTEGWVAGLQLVAISLQGRRDVASLVARVTGAHHYIVDYLVEEVLDRQDNRTRLFLMRTSILGELCGPLCDVVTGDQNSAAVLVRLERANLLLTPLDEERRWYRYHHLFAQCLRGRLEAEEPENVPELHRRAGQWYEGQGLVDEAIGHLLIARDFEAAARLIEAHAPRLLEQGRIVVVLNWANRLPEPLVLSRPHLGGLVGRALALGGQMDAAESCLLRVEETLEGLPQPDAESLRGQTAAVRAIIASQRADAPRTIEYARQAVSHLPRSESFLKSLAAFNLGDAHLSIGDIAPASAALADAAELSLDTGSLHLFAVSSAYLARTEMLRGRLGEAERVCHRALEVAVGASKTPARTIPTLGMLYAYLGHLRRELDDLEGAGRYLGQAVELAERSGYVESLATSYWGLAQLLRAQADLPAGLTMIERAIGSVRATSLTGLRRLLLAERADLLMALGRLEEAESWARERRVGGSLDHDLSHERECLSLVRLRLARGEAGEAEKLLARLLGPAEAAGRFGVVIELLALQALGLHQSGKVTPALYSLERALVLARPEGYVRTFADHGESMSRLLRQVAPRAVPPEYVARLLAAIGSPGRSSPEQVLPPRSDAGSVGGRPPRQAARGDRASAMGTGKVEPLTAREVEVLWLLAGGAPNQAIADRLRVSVGTAKAHISHILGKLGAHNRTEAVARARQLGLLERG